MPKIEFGRITSLALIATAVAVWIALFQAGGGGSILFARFSLFKPQSRSTGGIAAK
jgi:hypothetical protein